MFSRFTLVISSNFTCLDLFVNAKSKVIKNYFLLLVFNFSRNERIRLVIQSLAINLFKEKVLLVSEREKVP